MMPRKYSGEGERLETLTRLHNYDYEPVSIGRGVALAITGVNDQDDCAVVAIDGECDLVMGSDYVRGAEFSLTNSAN